MDHQEGKSDTGETATINQETTSKQNNYANNKSVQFPSSFSHLNKLGLKILYTNADNGLLNKRDQLKTRIDDSKPDIILITEILPKNRLRPVENIELKLDGYDLFTNIPTGSKRGVLIYTKTTLKASPCKTDMESKFEENCWCEVKLKGKDKILIGCIYRSPNSDLGNNDKLLVSMKELCTEKAYSHLLLCGDFNYPGIDWSNETSPHNDNHPATLFLECIRDCFLFQHCMKPTHMRGGIIGNTLDLIFTNEESMITNINHDAPLGNSDHMVLTFNLNAYIDENKKPIQRYVYDKGNYEEMRKELKTMDWETATDMKIDDHWALIKGRINTLVNKYIPKCNLNKPKRPIWMNQIALAKVRKKQLHLKDTWKQEKEKTL